MTTYTQEGCPFKDDCPDPDHHHDERQDIRCPQGIHIRNIRMYGWCTNCAALSSKPKPEVLHTPTGEPMDTPIVDNIELTKQEFDELQAKVPDLDLTIPWDIVTAYGRAVESRLNEGLGRTDCVSLILLYSQEQQKALITKIIEQAEDLERTVSGKTYPTGSGIRNILNQPKKKYSSLYLV